MSDDVKRSYDSTLRREAAALTRQKVIDAARSLLLEQGYAATSMGQIAAAAGVAVQTVYNATGAGKAGLVKLVWDVTLAGDLDPVPIAARPRMQELRAEPDPARKLAIYAEVSRTLYERLGPLAAVLRAGAAAGDPDLRHLIETTDDERLRGTTEVARHVRATGSLRREMTIEQAGQRLWALTMPEIADGLTHRCGWTLDNYQGWLTESMTCAVLNAASSPTR